MPIGSVSYEYEIDDGTKIYKSPQDFTYEFNIVTDDDFIEPDIEEYEINEWKYKRSK